MTKTFNGWANYETWACKLWIDNEQASYLYRANAARDAFAEAKTCPQVGRGLWTEDEAPRILLADRLKREITDAAPDLGASLYSDLLLAAISEIDWCEIADALLEEHAEQSAEAEEVNHD